jgi:uncharacterized membrane protein YoaK (UPF0700 family)
MTSEPDNRTSPVLRALAPLIVIECLFTLSGGYLDAYAFIAQGHVFANAQTGNVVLFAVYAAMGDRAHALLHIPPIIAFVLGVIAAKLLGVQTEKRTFRATLFCQSIEFVVLLWLCAFGPQPPNKWVVPLISFVAALQITSFDRLGPWSFNSAMTTGNLKNATIGFVLWINGQESEMNRGKAVVSLVACVSFVTGALIGAFYTQRHRTGALVPVLATVLAGIVLTWRQHRLYRD